MKQIYNRRLAVALMCLFFVANSYAEYISKFEMDGLYFGIKSTTPEGITFVTNPPEIYNIKPKDYAKGDIIIPRKACKKRGNSYDYYTVTSIGYRAFRGCINLNSVVIANSVTEIESEAFSGSGLTSVTIPNSVTTIGGSAFEWCTGLTSVTIPNSVTVIGYYAFKGCTGLTSMTIPNSVEAMGSNPFAGCSIESLGINDTNPYFAEENSVLYSKDMKKLKSCFNKNVGVVNIPNSVTEIEEYAFYLCDKPISVVMPNSITEIGEYAFKGCTGLTSVTIPNSVTEIGKSAFYGCTGLTSVTIPNSVTEIGEYAFYGCTGLTSVTIPNSVTVIGGAAFKGCTGLTSVTIPNSVTEIGESAFSSCTGLTSVTIPNSVTEIGYYAFKGCTGLTSVTIPNSVTYIGSSAFSGCDLEYIDCMAVVPPSAGDFGLSTYKNTILYVPKGSLRAYESADSWCNFFNIEEKDFSGIGDVEADAMEVTVSVNGGRITVSGVADGSDIEVYDMAGRRVYAGTESSVGGLSSGAYVVRVSGHPYKVMVR